ncbi:hypothetical protein GALL_431730 [mine drainage metagenome]|uniref:HTH crp-type domain-containing protein n=1 Tax=mine drainage metagenome TaxID=410659 RepID=A0A1J5PWA8_9ZZZZ
MADMLGLRRLSITKVAGELYQKHLIDYSRGNIRILDRTGLEHAACTCYRIIKNLQDSTQSIELLPDPWTLSMPVPEVDRTDCPVD